MKTIAVIPARYASTRMPGKPLADVLGLTLADLMHCHDSRQKDDTPPVPLEDFFTMLRRQHTDLPCGEFLPVQAD